MSADSDSELEGEVEHVGEAAEARRRSVEPRATPKKRGGGRPTKVAGGKKWCNGCHKQFPVSEFPLKSAQRLMPCRHALDNIRNVASSQGKLPWFTQKLKTESGPKELVDAYIRRCGMPVDKAKSERKKGQSFPILQYLQSLRVAEQLLRDGVFEMQHEVAFIRWASKPRNVPPRGLTADEAKLEFVERSRQTDAIVDWQGP